MSMKELGLFCRNTLGATSGINQDGGGSSAMWINGEIINTPSDGRERPVANGMMMVEVLPKEVSTAFTPGDSIVSTTSADIRLGPGSNYQTVHTADPDIIGRVRRHRNFLDGVLATDSNWWKVDLDGFVGWVDESSIGISDTMESPAVQE